MRYQTSMEGPLAITLVTGFLGSGKTTLIRRWLSEPAIRGSLVIVNDLAPVGLDHLLLQGGDHAPILLANGCICCTVNQDLGVTLLDVLRRTRAGELPPVSHAIVETTGMADPVPVMRLLADHPALATACTLERIVTLVDVRHGAAQIARFAEARLQVAVADFLVLGHVDEADDVERQDLARELAALNPVAAIVGDAARFSAGTLLARARIARLPDRIAAPLPTDPTGTRHEIQVACLTARRPIEWERLVGWIERIGERHRDNLLRIKGTVSVAGQANSVFINGVQQSFYPPILLPDRIDPFGGSQLVVIGRNLDPAALQAEFAALED